MDYKELPLKIKAQVTKEKSGILFAELPDYGIFTQADNPLELFLNVNDIIYSYFDIPQKDWGKVWYAPAIKEQKRIAENDIPMNPVLFSVLAKPNVQEYHFK